MVQQDSAMINIKNDPTKLVDNSQESIVKAGNILRGGGLVVIPTETVYGLGANALDAAACAKIFAAKKRPFFDPLICHISSLEMMSLLTGGMSTLMGRITRQFWPGPLTIVCEKNDRVTSIVTSGLQTVAVRYPAHPDAQRIITAAGVPVAAPSANLFGALSPTRAQHTLDLYESVDLIVDGGPCSVGVESTIIREHEGKLYLLRPGGISAEEIEACANLQLQKVDPGIIDAPGQLPSHYAPTSPVVLIDEGAQTADPENSCLLAFRKNIRNAQFLGSSILSEDGSLTEAAARLFDELHRLDELRPARIYAERTPLSGLGRAIMDRLQKAAAK